MNIPGEFHPAWTKAISGKGSATYGMLATRMIVGRLSFVYQQDPSPKTTRQSVAELRAFFEKNIDLPAAQADLKKILGEF